LPPLWQRARVGTWANGVLITRLAPLF
jgi:hypothetical protein